MELTSKIERSVKEELASSGGERLEHWRFYIERKTLIVTEPGSPVTLRYNDPHILPFDAEFNIQSTVQFLQQSSIPAARWKPRIQIIKNEVHQTVVALQSIRNEERLLSTLRSRALSIDQQLDRMKDFIVKFHEDQGYEVSVERAAPMLVPIPVATSPVGGTIRVLKYLNYRKCLIFGIPANLWPWQTLNQAKEPLAGRYRYWVSWPDGRTAQGDMRIMSTEPIVFSPQ